MKKPFCLLISLLLLSACTEQTSKQELVFRPILSLQEIMLSIVDPNIDYVWNSVSTVSTSKGVEEKKPVTDEDWLQVKQHAQTVLEAANLLLVPGRHVVTGSANTSSGGAELSAEQIQALIDNHQTEFVQRSHELQDAILQVLAAIDQKDVEAFENAGGAVEHACEQCHTQFWYPNDARPK